MTKDAYVPREGTFSHGCLLPCAGNYQLSLAMADDVLRALWPYHVVLFYWIRPRSAWWEDMEIYIFGTAQASDLYVRVKFITTWMEQFFRVWKDPLMISKSYRSSSSSSWPARILYKESGRGKKYKRFMACTCDPYQAWDTSPNMMNFRCI